MDVLLKFFFKKLMESERTSLHAQYRRRATVYYFNTLIEGCSKAESRDPRETCRDAVRSIIRFHDDEKNKNLGICLMGKYHNILYIAVRLCYWWQVKDTGIVAALLDQIYSCEKTFERIWVGALFGTASQFIAGWKSDFNDEEENLRAVVYYLDHANNAGLEFKCENKIRLQRFVDVPIESCGRASPVKIFTQLGLSDKLHILLRFGAVITTEEGESESLLESVLTRLNQFNGAYPYNLLDCLVLLLRAVPSIQIQPSLNDSYENGSNVQRDYMLDHYPKLVDCGIIPRNRCGIEPPELKHLCRCEIRYRLWLNYHLPSGTRILPIPEVLKRYLDLMSD